MKQYFQISPFSFFRTLYDGTVWVKTSYICPSKQLFLAVSHYPGDDLKGYDAGVHIFLPQDEMVTPCTSNGHPIPNPTQHITDVQTHSIKRIIDV